MFHRYEILGYLASGGKGNVYRAKDINLDLTVALKTLIRDASSDKELVRFQTEAKLASKLVHENIATIFDFGLYEATPYLSMEYVDGESLQSLIDRKRTVPLSFVIDVAIQVIDALNYAHSQGIVHRDIKPANVALSDKSAGLAVKVLDFGVAKKLDVALISNDGKVTVTGDVIGSPFYMSPEQSKGEKVGPASDAYSLGCLMWTCLVGQPPLCGDSLLETLTLVQNTVPESIATHVEHLPEVIVSVVDRLLSKSADQRPHLRDEVLPLLLKTRETLNSSQVDIKSDSTAGSAQKFVVSRSVSLTILSLCLILVFGVTMSVILPRSNLMEKPQDARIRDLERQLREPLPKVDDSNEGMPEQAYFRGSAVTIVNCNDRTLDKKKYQRLTVEEVSLRSSDITDRCFNVLSAYPNLKYLTLTNVDVSDLTGVERLTGLRLLKIQRCPKLKDSALDKLGNLKELTSLVLHNCVNITDAALPTIAKIKSLQTLGLEGTGAIGASVDSLLDLKKLVGLDMVRTGVTVGDVRKILSGLPNLKIINISHCKNISEEQAKQLAIEFPDRRFLPAAASFLIQAQKAIQRAANDEQFAIAITKTMQRVELLKNVGGAHNPELIPAYRSLGQYYSRVRNLSASRQWYKKALELANMIGDTKQQLYAYSGLDHVAILESRNHLTPKLEQSILKTLSFAERNMPPNSFEMAIQYGHLGDTYKMCRNSEASIAWYRKALRTYDQLKDSRTPPMRAQLHIHLAEALSDVGKLEEAEIQAKIGIEQLSEIRPLPRDFRVDFCRAYSALATNAIRSNNYERALEFNDNALAQLKRFDIIVQRFHRELYIQRALILTKLGRSNDAAAATGYVNSLQSN
ncbi:MAG: protein kinase [Candidatus Obscuribacterales bacterium]|nr:protein kinase [Candidatus Obscuribacterales bacterium]